MYRCGEQLNKARMLVIWYSPFSDNTGTSITDSGATQVLRYNDHTASIQDATPFGSIIKSTNKKSSGLFSFTASPDAADIQASVIHLSYNSTLFRQWFGKNPLEKEAEKSLENLKTYMTDTKRFYGFEIQEVKVEDTAFLFSRAIFPIAQKRSGIIKLFDKLIAFAEKNQSGYNGTRILYMMESGNEITLFAGIGVTVAANPAPGSEIEYKRMPLGKNLLMTNYQGPFGQSGKAFEALQQFKSDHQLTGIAIPYQKIMSDGYDFADDQMVQLRVYYPVF